MNSACGTMIKVPFEGGKVYLLSPVRRYMYFEGCRTGGNYVDSYAYSSFVPVKGTWRVLVCG